MNQNNPLDKLLLEAAENYPDRIAAVTPVRAVSYSELNTEVTNLAVNLQRQGIGRGSLVGLQVTKSPLLATISILAVTRLGAQWIEYDIYLRDQDIIRPTHLLHDNSQRNDLSGQWGTVQSIFIDERLCGPPADHPLPYTLNFAGYESADDTWYVAASSGTTGVRKNMAISGRMFFNSIKRMREYPIAGHPLIATDLFRRTAHIASLHFMNILRLSGTYVFSRNYEFLAQQRVCLVVGSPAHLAALLENVPPPDEPRLIQARVVGGALLPQFLDRLLKYFETVRVSYGSTETGTLCTHLLAQSTGDRSLGTPYPGVEVQIVDENDELLAAENEGMVRVKADSQVKDYLNNPAASANAFRNGWFYPGDRGYLSAQGELYVTGRAQEELNIGGAKLNARLLDDVLQAHEQVKDGLCFVEVNADGEQTLAVAIAFEAVVDKKTVVKELVRSFLVKYRDHWQPLPKKIYELDNIPRNANGKLMRQEAASAVQDLKPIALIGDR